MKNKQIDTWVANQLAALAHHPNQRIANDLASKVIANADKKRSEKPEVAVKEPEPHITKKEDTEDVELQK